ncbi:tetraspanin [Truncatella angustata]|uniref:Tetraspanin n=1 Tax=Truncatella angustata TaxID=152316 RepID=A0A9P8RHE4_9PEZI|nr:tetraspanin [Truncatella angustata]KAH6645897.1 tetraspanin [Truncatella angustata]
MPSPVLFYIILTFGLVAAAIYVLVSSSNLSLPISLGTRILTIILPVLATANVYLTPRLQSISRAQKGRALAVLVPAILQVAQGILTVILATLAFEGLIPGVNLNCNLHNVWQQLWKSHDSRSIERIQDAFNCCGLVSLRDMSEPHHGTDTGMCSSLYHRSSPCAGPWTSAMQRNSGVEFGVAIAVGILQLLDLTLFRLGSVLSQSRRGFRPLLQSSRSGRDARLLENGPDEEDHTAEAEDVTESGTQDYGTTNNGANPRVEPSNLGDDASPWRS